MEIRFNPLARVFTVFLAMSISSGIAIAKKDRDWQTGKLLDSQRSEYLAGTVGRTNAAPTAIHNPFGNHTRTTQTAVYGVSQTFVIESDAYTYLAQEQRSKPANLTVNGRVKFAVEKLKLFVLDDDGKEHEMQIIKKTAKEPTARAE